MDLKPIKTEDEHQAALAEIERLFDAEPGSPDADKLNVWTTLVQEYERKHYALPMPDPVEAILYFMESRGLTRRDLEPYIGSRARVSEILNRQRPLTLAMIRRLHQGLGIPVEVLVQPYEVMKAA